MSYCLCIREDFFSLKQFIAVTGTIVKPFFCFFVSRWEAFVVKTLTVKCCEKHLVSSQKDGLQEMCTLESVYTVAGGVCSVAGKHGDVTGSCAASLI